MSDVMGKILIWTAKVLFFLPALFFILLPIMLIDGEKGADAINGYWGEW